MKIVDDIKEVQVSVREFASYSDSETQYAPSILSSRLRATLGTEVHKQYQDAKNAQHDKSQSEYYVKIMENVDDWSVIIRGRVDMVYEKNGFLIVEEIKSVLSTDQITVNKSHKLQLQIYGHYFRTLGHKVKCYLVYYDVVSDSYIRKIVPAKDMSDYIFSQTRDIINIHEENQLEKINVAKKPIKLRFPYSSYRQNQKKIIDTVSQILQKKKDYLLRAPAGLGKTVATLYPSLKYSLKHKLKLFIATSKTTQQKIYSDTVKEMIKSGGEFKSITLTAKEKICNNTEFICDPQFCPYLKNYSEETVVKGLTLLEDLPVLNSRSITKVANKTKICAFELSLDASLTCDIIICDYNYIFHPGIRLHRYFHVPYDNSVLIIDEAHNLPNRARDYYSPSISLEQIYFVKEFLSKSLVLPQIRTEGIKLLDKLARYIRQFNSQIPTNRKWDAITVTFDHEKFQNFQKQFDEFAIEYAREILEILRETTSKGDPMLLFVEELRYFTALLKDSDSPEFSQLYYSKGILKILCKSAEAKLSEQISGFHSVIGQSATLFPLDYFRKLLGLPEDTLMESFPSPYPKENQLYMIYPYIPTTYAVRSQYYDKIAVLIARSMDHCKGNYLAFFPSFSFLTAVLSELQKLDLSVELLVQQQKMSYRQRISFLKKLRNKSTNYLLLGVHGGIFSEGVDFIGDMGIGTFIVGPALPAYTFEQELMKEYYEEKYGKGFEYAYRNPGMNKVIQASGRIFRTNTDKGFVMLVGSRFNTPYYRMTLPEDWQISVGPQVIEEIQSFWSN